ncbi:MAG: DUF1707 and DUF2154 domain-containing protein [Gemmatimonadales bacterium]|nr:MAG: DUF1707 and DUF2154 domain-containing protein [Gemmatimonadales bacterium]
MSNEDPRPPERDWVVESLGEHYAQDRLDIAEFERRVDLAHRSRTRDELRALLSDLPSLEQTLPAPTGPAPTQGGVSPSDSTALAPRVNSGRVADRQTEVAIWSGRSRKGPWMPARTVRGLAFMGGIELDFREALLPPGETRVFIAAVMGGAEILVPPGVRVETDGFAFMGGFDEDMGGEPGPPPGPDAPVIRVSGFALMGGVEVVCRLPGESARDAKRRRKETARRLRSGEDAG